MSYAFRSGNVALDLAGTVGHRDGPDRHDHLTGPAVLAAWTVDAGLLDRAPEVDGAGLASAVRLRESVYALARARVEGRAADADDLAVLNAAAEAPPVTPRMRADGTTLREGDLTAALSEVARSLIGLLGGPAATGLKACQAHPCTRLYLDSSRRGGRRWCDMRECGNRAKAAAYRRRQAGDRAGS
jgi:predicted RNA-binding Zn ribbon-like protein